MAQPAHAAVAGLVDRIGTEIAAHPRSIGAQFDIGPAAIANHRCDQNQRKGNTPPGDDKAGDQDDSHQRGVRVGAIERDVAAEIIANTQRK